MDSTGPSVMVMLVICLLAVATLFAWAQSERRRRYVRVLALYVQAKAPGFWAALPWHARNLNIAGAVERYRRAGGPEDPVFSELYAAKRHASRLELVNLLVGMALVGLLALGLNYWGWHF